MWRTRIILMLCHLTSTWCYRYCSILDKVMLDLSVPEETHGKALRTLHNLTRISSPLTSKVDLIRVEWESVYCPAVELGPFQDCQQVAGEVKMDFRDLEEMKKYNRVSRPGSCKQSECDGMDEFPCLHPSTFYLDNPPFSFGLELSSSWIHHRCARRISSVKIEAETIMLNEGVNSVSMEVPGIGKCFFDPKDMGCIIENRWVALLDKKWKRKVEFLQFPCIEKGSERVCYDKENQFQFLLESGNCNVLNGITYCRNATDVGGRRSNDVEIVTPETVYELSLQLEYENLENSFDHQIILSKFRKINLLLSSILLYNLGVSPDPLQDYLGFGLSNLTRSGRNVTGNVCHKVHLFEREMAMGLGQMVNLSLFEERQGFGEYEEMISRLPSIRKPDLTGNTHFNLTKVKHGNSSVINSIGLIDSVLPPWIRDFPKFITHILPIVNSIVIFVYLLKRK